MSCIHSDISGIPSIIASSTEIPRATVILYHGWASKIEDYLFFASIITSWGYKVIVPELPYHGVRGKLNYFETKELQTHFWKVVLQGVSEVEGIVATLSESDENISIIGSSTGAFIAAGAFTNISCLQSAVIINGSCAWVKFEEMYREKDGRPPLSNSERNLLNKHDPMTNLSLGEEKTLLLLHGKEDSTIPIESQRYFMLEASRTQKDYLQLVEYSGVNHQITMGMLEQSKAWLDKRYS